MSSLSGPLGQPSWLEDFFVSACGLRYTAPRCRARDGFDEIERAKTSKVSARAACVMQDRLFDGVGELSSSTETGQGVLPNKGLFSPRVGVCAAVVTQVREGFVENLGW